MSMNKNIYLALAIVVIIITALGVYAFSSYKTTIDVKNLGGSPVNGEYKLVVKILVNYGPFGGIHPLGSADVWIYYNGKYYNQSLTDSNGVVTFYLPPGNYTLFFTVFHIKYNINLDSNYEVTLNYAYLKST
ncbi:hypothetical protein YN1HA_0260 [Sulfurisphaera ohwakuensis]